MVEPESCAAVEKESTSFARVLVHVSDATCDGPTYKKSSCRDVMMSKT